MMTTLEDPPKKMVPATFLVPKVVVDLSQPSWTNQLGSVSFGQKFLDVKGHQGQSAPIHPWGLDEILEQASTFVIPKGEFQPATGEDEFGHVQREPG